jgi:Arc/MetJ family transcription regulator
MRTTLDLDPKLLSELVEVTGEKSKSKAVHKALEEYVRRRRIEELRGMLGKMNLATDWYEFRHAEPR